MVRGFGLPAALALSVVLARVLGPEEYGIYSFIVATALFLDKPLTGSVGTIMVRQVAHRSATVLGDALKNVFPLVTKFALICILFWVVTLLVANALMTTQTGAIANDNNYYILLLLPFLFLFGLGASLLRSMHLTTLAILPEQLLKPVLMLVALGFIYAFQTTEFALEAGRMLDIYLLVLFFLTCGAFAVARYYYLRVKRQQEKTDTQDVAPESTGISENPRTFTTLYFMSIIQAVNAYMPILFLSYFHEAETVGIYRAATNIATNIGLGLLAVNLTVSPRIVRAYKNGDLVAVQRLLVLGTRVIIAIALPLALIFIAFSAPLVDLLFGAAYAQSAQVLVWLSIAFLINAVCGPVAMTLNMLKLEKETIRAVALAASVNCTCCLLLVPSFGAIGAAYSIIACFTIWNAVLMLRLYQLRGLLVLPYVTSGMLSRLKRG